MSKTIYFILLLAFSVNSCSSKNIPVQEISPVEDVKVVNTRKKSALDSAQVIQINNRNRKKSILNPSKSKEKKGL